MPQIRHDSFETYLETISGGDAGKSPAPVYLIFGEAFLCTTVFKALINRLIPPQNRSLNYEPVDGLKESIHTALEKVNTYAFLGGRKVVAYTGARLFQSKRNAGQFLDNARLAWDEKDFAKAAGQFARMLSVLQLSWEDLSSPESLKSSGLSILEHVDDRWLRDVLDYCLEKGTSIPPAADDAAALEGAVAKGFPRGNHLLIVTDAVDRRRSLFKSIDKAGMIIDCRVPTGDRYADRKAQTALLREKAAQVLAPHGKTMNPNAIEALLERTGFELRSLAVNLEKLVLYVGAAPRITAEDVEAALARTKKDPIYDLTNAMADRDLDGALFLLKSLLADGSHPLQVLAAIINRFRRILAAKLFTASAAGRVWHDGCAFPEFKTRVLPGVQAWDRELAAGLKQWEELLGGSPGDRQRKPTGKGEKKPSGPKTDLFLAPNPKNPYPIYMSLKGAQKFTEQALLEALALLSETDVALKSVLSGEREARLALEKLIFRICG